ncbi:MAG: efflux RND transporter periplasmic adaptor subunit [Verrucomicrobiales bacterium]
MKKLEGILLPLIAIGTVSAVAQEPAIDPDRIANTIILDETGVKNLRIQTEMVEERDFETTVFAVGRIEEKPENRAVVSSRISGRIVELKAFVGDDVKKGDVIARVESRQPGSPPPVIDLVAPMSGIVVDSHVRLGEPVEPSQDILDISDRSEMWAVAKIPESEAHKIKPGTKARMKVPALDNGHTVIEMKRFGVSADREAGTVDGIFVVENPEGHLKPGMRAEFGIITSTREFVMSVPREAVQGDPSKRVVFVEDFDIPNAFVKAPVVLGEQNDQYVEVIQGLFPGDEVVTRGSYGLSFAGGGSGISLKEALDAAHGHEHNEDGSEMTPEQKAAREAEAKGHDHGAHGSDSTGTFDVVIRIWAGIATIMALLWLQGLFRRRKDEPAAV